MTSSRENAENAFLTWIDYGIPDLTAVILKHQLVADTERPELPYATVEWLRDRAPGAPYRRVGDETNPTDPDGLTHEHIIREFRIGVAQLTVYGDDAPGLLAELHLTRWDPTVLDGFHSSKTTIRQLGDIVSTFELRDTVNEQIAFQDFAISYGQEKTDLRIGTIETLDADIDILYQGE